MKVFYMKEEAMTRTLYPTIHRATSGPFHHIFIPEHEIHILGEEWHRSDSGFMNLKWLLEYSKFRGVPEKAHKVEIDEDDFQQLIKRYRMWEEEYDRFKVQAADEINWSEIEDSAYGIQSRTFKGRYNVLKFEERFSKIADKIITELEQRFN